MIRLPEPPSSPNSLTSITLHSNCTGDSFTLNGFMVSDSIGVKPLLMNSSISGPYGELANDICSTME